MTQATGALKDLLIAQPAEQLVALLTSSSDVKIAVPCSVLSKSAKSSACKVVVQVKGSVGSELLLDCGSFWKGGESCPGLLHYPSEHRMLGSPTLEGALLGPPNSEAATVPMKPCDGAQALPGCGTWLAN